MKFPKPVANIAEPKLTEISQAAQLRTTASYFQKPSLLPKLTLCKLSPTLPHTSRVSPPKFLKPNHNFSNTPAQNTYPRRTLLRSRRQNSVSPPSISPHSPVSPTNLTEPPTPKCLETPSHMALTILLSTPVGIPAQTLLSLDTTTLSQSFMLRNFKGTLKFPTGAAI